MPFSISELTAEGCCKRQPELCRLLQEAVEAGASIGFLRPLPPVQAETFWRETAEAVAQSRIRLLISEAEGRVLGTVQLSLPWKPNARHRAELVKLLVDPRVRRRGLGAALLQAAERLAAADGRWLLVLDTRSGDPAERLYRRAGWQETGIVPDYAMSVDGVPEPVIFMHKRLAT